MPGNLLRKAIALSSLILFCAAAGYAREENPALSWPPQPAQARISFVKSVYSPSDLGIKGGFAKKLKAIIFGAEQDILNKPMAIALDTRGRLYVCDAGEPAGLHIFAPKEKRYKKITAVNNTALISPVGVAVSGDGRVFLADSALRKVFCLDSEGRFKSIIGREQGLLRPTGLSVGGDRLYVVDTLAASVLVFDLAGNFILRFGSRGKGEGQFNYPTSISVDDEGNVYIVDALNFRVQVFDKTHKFLYSIGEAGDSSGSFARPKAVAVDSFGHIYVTDGMFDNIQIFNRKKEFLLSLGEAGNKQGEFWMPCGLAIDREDYIYVADSYNRRLQILRYIGKE